MNKSTIMNSNFGMLPDTGNTMNPITPLVNWGYSTNCNHQLFLNLLQEDLEGEHESSIVNVLTEYGHGLCKRKGKLLEHISYERGEFLEISLERTFNNHRVEFTFTPIMVGFGWRYTYDRFRILS